MASKFVLDIYCRCFNGHRNWAHMQIACFDGYGYELYDFGCPLFFSTDLVEVIERLNNYLVEVYHEDSL